MTTVTVMGKRRDDRGDSYIELVVSILIISVTAVALLNALITTIAGSALHRSLTNDDTLAKSYLDTVKYVLRLSPSHDFVGNCAGTGPTTILRDYQTDVPAWSSSNQPAGFSVKTGYGVAVTGVQCWTVTPGTLSPTANTPATGQPDTTCVMSRSASVTTGCAGHTSADNSGVEVVTITATDPNGDSVDLSTLVVDPSFQSNYGAVYVQ